MSFHTDVSMEVCKMLPISWVAFVALRPYSLELTTNVLNNAFL